ncbi:uncharacterized protein LAESUDRAFT_814400 [Laetiporus sulphureus 93-53]|uniref:DUF6533 domain-containing protein n=1 Tax=Laetiporus sulphureus 93-53 TaxID=1314785 RepID=A0A165CY82_9APHY|nr:uncharacterized protein LAESUDRAFT_814400 [Laetiporus sulphureus 93-53]KZT03728.1 hypothetical protein LAESUDRAFT_814400 [Laetiporus sulphureus 93-53]
MSIATSEAIAVLDESFTQNYAIIAALILFDHAITFGQEVQLFWGERSFSAWLFFANRTLALSYAIISVWSLMNLDTVTTHSGSDLAFFYLNIRAAARSTRREQSQTPSFVRSQRGLEAQGDVEDMSFELNILSSTERAQETGRAHLQDSMEHDQIIAEPRSMADDAAAVADARQDVGEEEGIDEVEEEMLSGGENDM